MLSSSPLCSRRSTIRPMWSSTLCRDSMQLSYLLLMYSVAPSLRGLPTLTIQCLSSTIALKFGERVAWAPSYMEEYCGTGVKGPCGVSHAFTAMNGLLVPPHTLDVNWSIMSSILFATRSKEKERHKIQCQLH